MEGLLNRSIELPCAFSSLSLSRLSSPSLSSSSSLRSTCIGAHMEGLLNTAVIVHNHNHNHCKHCKHYHNHQHCHHCHWMTEDEKVKITREKKCKHETVKQYLHSPVAINLVCLGVLHVLHLQPSSIRPEPVIHFCKCGTISFISSDFVLSFYLCLLSITFDSGPTCTPPNWRPSFIWKLHFEHCLLLDRLQKWFSNIWIFSPASGPSWTPWG